MSTEMNDRQFLSYMESHCRTERKLFSRAQWERLCTLANAPVILWQPEGAEWGPLDPDIIDPLVKDARKTLCPSMSSEATGSLECELHKGHSCFHKAGGITWEDDIYDAVAQYRQEHADQGLSTPEPAPIKNDRPIIQDLVIADLEKRKQVGLERYGTYLQPGNGRDALVDLYQELIDATQYIRQEIEERFIIIFQIVEWLHDAGIQMPERGSNGRSLQLGAVLSDIRLAIQDLKAIKSERDTLLRERDGEVWFWTTGDPEDGDNAATITCPIIIQPETLLAIIEQGKTDLYLAGEISKARDQIVEQRDELIGQQLQQPIAVVLHCPRCGVQHIDKEETEDEYTERVNKVILSPYNKLGDRPARWTNPPHKSHLCHVCKAIWRPAEVYTVGVASVKPGKNDTWTP